MDRYLVLLVTLSLGVAVQFSYAAHAAATPMAQAPLLAAYALFSMLALGRMYRDGTLLDLFRWRSGDVFLGFVSALLLGLGTLAGRWLLAPTGSRGELWLIRIYLHVGEVPVAPLRWAMMMGGIILFALVEEIVWRGWVQQILEEAWGVRWGWLATVALYGSMHLPTLWLLAMPSAGGNPLLLLLAIFCGLLWGFLVGRLQRLPPAIVSHVFFTYALTMQFRLWH